MVSKPSGMGRSEWLKALGAFCGTGCKALQSSWDVVLLKIALSPSPQGGSDKRDPTIKINLKSCLIHLLFVQIPLFG